MALDFTRRQWLTLMIMGLADFCNAICVSLQAPFFPNEAESKGATATEYGLVFGIFELVVFIISPIYGQYINRIGPKVLFNSGIFTTGTSAILFGLLDRVPGHVPFITLAFVIRIVEALGNAAFLTASFAIIAKEFPNNVATTFASLETCFGLGLIVGPMVGGALYTVGGYYLPFVVLGSALFITAILTLCILPKHPNEEPPNREKSASLLTVLKIPGVVVCALAICATSASIGFLSATMEPHLRQFDLSPILLGVVFVINGGVYALTAPIWGWGVDKFLNPKVVSAVGCFLVVGGFCMVGPASFIPLDTNLSYVITGLVLHGLGIAAVLVSSFTDALNISIKKGLPDNIETYGLISGLWTSTFAFGAFVGPSVSGFLFDAIGFRASTVFIIGLQLVVGIITILFLCFERTPAPYKEISSAESLIKPTTSSQDGDSHNESSASRTSSLDITYRGNKSGFSGSQSSLIGSWRPSVNNLLISNSYQSKQGHWARSVTELETNSGTQYGTHYGSFDARPGYHDTMA
ncbi:MFS-type transporter SLC18B1-like [Anopheles stephensi]|uniref:Major facilitator superfamily (MFS) profile domain-containing protein n=1 Tax=Anopheles stephensi TaxID=30069 RepID=A0A182XVT6_ANOST|nr:MFS-type transporter SLC18B1-like [Anopheles stephensi]